MNRETKRSRLERAGFVHYSGWLPAKNPAGPRFADQVAAFAEDVEKLLAEPVKPRGRPKKALRAEIGKLGG